VCSHARNVRLGVPPGWAPTTSGRAIGRIDATESGRLRRAR
jgi:hypothetical protein